MANQSLPTPQIVLDADGLPVPGAQAFYYQSGTLTLISVYSDQAGTILTTNPVIANGDGALAQSYVDVAAKAIVKDANGATLYTLDPVPVIQSVGSGAAQISFSPTVFIPATEVQAAVALVDTNWRAATATLTTSKQNADADLTALADLTTTGIAVRTATNTWAHRTIASADGSVVVTNPGGLAGNIDIATVKWVEVAGSPFTISGASPYIVSGLGGYREVRVTGNAVTASVAGGRWMRVGNSGGILSTAIYLEAGAAVAGDRIANSASVTAARSFTVEIADFNTTNAFKPLAAHISSATDDLNCPGISSALAFDRISIENSVAATLGGTVRIWGRK